MVWAFFLAYNIFDVLRLGTFRILPNGRYHSEENKHLTMYYISVDNEEQYDSHAVSKHSAILVNLSAHMLFISLFLLSLDVFRSFIPVCLPNKILSFLVMLMKMHFHIKLETNESVTIPLWSTHTPDAQI